MLNVCILSSASDPLAAEVESRVTAEGHSPRRLDPSAAGSEASARALAECHAVISVRPRCAADMLALGLSLGQGKKLVVLDAGADLQPLPGALVAASLDEMVKALRDIAPPAVFVDAGYFRSRSGCDEGVEWFARRYPKGGSTSEWTLEEQLQAIRDGGARWLRRGQAARLVRVWPMDGVDLRGADLRGAEFRGYSFVGAHLEGADLSGGELRAANLRHARLTGAKLAAARLAHADLRGADLGSALLTGALLRGARLSGADLSGADLSGADLSGADLSGVDLRRTGLSGAHFSSAILRGANLEGCDLGGLLLHGADLREARLSGADLTGANLSGADLRGAALERAVLTFAGLTGALGVVPKENLR
ncbi:pentapeptide repeat-containing protein [Sorangium sp. So ce726]|uniref:pentapeptide repeat-containing protein n=1 Tax=Sorangium sp. So ce726 TaxID=3133319 RepID=UPI003F609132